MQGLWSDPGFSAAFIGALVGGAFTLIGAGVGAKVTFNIERRQEARRAIEQAEAMKVDAYHEFLAWHDGYRGDWKTIPRALVYRLIRYGDEEVVASAQHLKSGLIAVRAAEKLQVEWDPLLPDTCLEAVYRAIEYRSGVNLEGDAALAGLHAMGVHQRTDLAAKHMVAKLRDRVYDEARARGELK
jgi:hypothetical protein